MLEMYWLQADQELGKLNTWWNFEFFGCNIEGEIVFQKRENFCEVKMLMSSYILCKMLSF